jgi:hypothetical protein
MAIAFEQALFIAKLLGIFYNATAVLRLRRPAQDQHKKKKKRFYMSSLHNTSWPHKHHFKAI